MRLWLCLCSLQVIDAATRMMVPRDNGTPRRSGGAVWSEVSWSFNDLRERTPSESLPEFACICEGHTMAAAHLALFKGLGPPIFHDDI